MTLRGMISTWTGACGRTSSNATQRSSSWTILAGISLRMIFRKMLSAIMTSAPLALRVVWDEGGVGGKIPDRAADDNRRRACERRRTTNNTNKTNEHE